MTSSVLLKNGRIVDPSRNLDEIGDLYIKNGHIGDLSETDDDIEIIDCTDKLIIPGLIDARVFIGEPGNEYRETILSAGNAAAAGGVTSLIMMPDTQPVIDDVALVEFIAKTGRDTAKVNVYPSAALTKGLSGSELSEFGLLTQAGAVFLTNGRQQIDNAMTLRRAFTYAKNFNIVVSLETQDNDLAGNGVMNEGLTASWMGLSGIPSEAEVIPLERDIRLAALTGVKYHAAKISVPASVEVIKRAKAQSDKITCGISINNLALNENDIGEYRTFFRLSPPLRSEDDRKAMVEALSSGDIDIIVSSHDPQDVEDKRVPFSDAAEGAVGLETLFCAALRLYHNDDVSLMRLVDAMSTRPAQIFNINGGTLKIGAPADVAVVDIHEPWVVSKSDLHSVSKNSAFEGARFSGRVVKTFVKGKLVFAL